MRAMTRRGFVGGAGVAASLALAACGCSSNDVEEQATETTEATTTDETTSVAGPAPLDAAAWQYNADDDVYYQLGISYCATPADESYEQLAIFVPGAFFEATDNGDGTYTCAPSDANAVGDFTASTAPIVMPVNTPGYSAQSPLTEYSSQTSYTSQGFVYAHAGCRGRDAGAPAGITDLKAAVRFLRASAANLAGNCDRIFTFGMSGGGAQSVLMGATGDSELYAPYLLAVGAADASDAVLGSMGWCPITGLDVGDEAYEWMMGCTREGLSDDEQAISDGLARAFADYVNEAGIVDEGGQTLTLDESDEGVFQAGSYYQRVVQAIETSINDFLSDTEFPYDASSSGMGGMGPGGAAPGGAAPGGPDGEDSDDDAMHGMGAGPDGKTGGARRGAGGPDFGDADAADGDAAADGMPEAGANATDGAPADAADAGADDASIEDVDDISRTLASGGVDVSGTYETATEYVAALNADEEWVAYDEATNTATITSVAAFCTALKQASKSLGAFDQLDRGQGENELFGIDGTAAHFDATLGALLDEAGNEYAADYAADLALTDTQGTDMQTRVNMYTPLYYLLPTQDGFGASSPAAHWRIRSGINQGDTALTTELNLALALEADERVESVDFAAVWGQGHTMAERTGSSDDNFVAWVKDCLA